MQPYQEATREIQRQGETPLRIGKAAAGIASAYYGGNLISKVAPWLSKYIPEDLMKKGLSKINPGFVKFIDNSLKSGKSIDEIRRYIGEKMQEGQSQDKAKQSKNIIEQESPELHQFLDEQIRKGRKPIEAAALAQNDRRFSSVVQKLSKTHKTPWSKIIESIYGLGENALPDQQQQQQSSQIMQQQQPRGLNPEIQAAIQKIMQM